MRTREFDYSAFYLHGGPGLSAIPEREAHGDAIGIFWWDQPRPTPGDVHPYAALIDAAETEFIGKAANNGGSLTLIANSFGANLALHLAHRIPGKISAVLLLAPVHDLGLGFTGFARCIAQSSEQRASLLAAAQAYEAAPEDRVRFWELVTAIVTAPRFSDHYWSPTATRLQMWFADLLANPAVFDFAAFQAITEDFLATPRLAVPSRFSGPVSIVLGKHDPLNDPATASRIWTEQFPQAEVCIVDAGHLMHLELPVQEWLRQ